MEEGYDDNGKSYQVSFTIKKTYDSWPNILYCIDKHWAEVGYMFWPSRPLTCSDDGWLIYQKTMKVLTYLKIFTLISMNSKKIPRSTMVHFRQKERMNVEWLWSPSLDYCRMLPHSGESRQVNDLQNIHVYEPKHTHVYKLTHSFPLLQECMSTRMIVSQDYNSEKLAKCDDKGTYHSDWFNFDPSLNGLECIDRSFLYPVRQLNLQDMINW